MSASRCAGRPSPSPAAIFSGGESSYVPAAKTLRSRPSITTPSRGASVRRIFSRTPDGQESSRRAHAATTRAARRRARCREVSGSDAGACPEASCALKEEAGRASGVASTWRASRRARRGIHEARVSARRRREVGDDRSLDEVRGGVDVTSPCARRRGASRRWRGRPAQRAQLVSMQGAARPAFTTGARGGCRRRE